MSPGIDLTLLRTSDRSALVISTVAENARGDEFVNRAVLGYIQGQPLEEQIALQAGRVLFWQVGPINSAFVPIDLESVPRLAPQNQVMLNQEQLHQLQKIAHIYARTLLIHISGAGADLPQFFPMFDQLAQRIALKALSTEPHQERYQLHVGQFQEKYMLLLDQARKEAERNAQNLVPASPNNNMRELLEKRQNAQLASALQAQAEGLAYINDSDPFIRNLALEWMLACYRKDSKESKTCLEQIKKIKEQHQIEAAEAAATALLLEEEAKPRARPAAAAAKRPPAKPAPKQASPLLKDEPSHRALPLGTVQEILQQAQGKQLPRTGSGSFQTVRGAKPLKPQKPRLEDLCYQQLTLPPTYFHQIATRVARWESGTLDEIRRFTDLHGRKQHRYLNMSQSQLCEQIQRHHFPGLDQLMNSAWFRENYCQLIENTWFLKVQRETEEGKVIWPLTLMSVSICDGTIYHAFAHPTQEILHSQGTPLCPKEEWNQLQEELRVTQRSSPAPAAAATALPFEVIRLPNHSLPNIRLTSAHRLPGVGVATFFPMNRRNRAG